MASGVGGIHGTLITLAAMLLLVADPSFAQEDVGATSRPSTDSGTSQPAGETTSEKTDNDDQEAMPADSGDSAERGDEHDHGFLSLSSHRRCCGEDVSILRRYDEDFSYLDEHPEYRELDPRLYIKNIELDEHWRLDVGGEFRVRVENRTNPLFGLDERTSNMQQNYREMMHINMRYRKLFRIFAQGINSHVESQNGPFQPLQENHGDLQQLFGDLRVFGESVPITLRVGRQELSYGHDRLVGAFEWASNRRRFDAAKLFYSGENWNIDAFFARPVVVERKGGDDWNDDYNFYGLYTTYKGWQKGGFDFYFFGVDRSDIVMNPNGHEGGRSVYTVGTRAFGTVGPVDFDIEFAEQWGKWAGDEVQGIFFEGDVGYSFEHEWKPRLSTGFGWASGDENPEDRHVQTWDQLFTYDHVCISMQDLVGRQNMTRWFVSVDAWPMKKLKASLYYHVYWLNQETDAYYNAGGIPVLRDEFGHSGNELGSAIELLLQYNVTEHSSFLFMYSHFWDETFVHNLVAGDDDPDLFFLQYQYRF
ncbi:MAG: alginate export family protein [Planctomycetes bacterium]|nr:alginate export family protein [Planctomycetota bacterium]